jgi:LAGLIDADG DNA endonuclease family
MNKIQKQIIVGKILGDAHLETQNNGRTYRIKIEHSIKQKTYVDWCYSELQDLTLSAPKTKSKLSYNTQITSYGFTSIATDSLRFYGQQFYVDKVKVIPKIIDKLLTPLSIAIWFMDDGSIKSKQHKSYVIHTNGYTKSDLEKIVYVFKKKFNIRVGIHKQYEQYRLYIYTESAEAFKKLIEMHVLPELQYKLGNTNA